MGPARGQRPQPGGGRASRERPPGTSGTGRPAREGRRRGSHARLRCLGRRDGSAGLRCQQLPASSLPAPCPPLHHGSGLATRCQGETSPGHPLPCPASSRQAGQGMGRQAGLPAAVWAAGSPWDTNTPCPCFPAWSSARLSCLSTARKQAHKQPAPGTDRYPQGQAPPGTGSQARPALSCPCKGSRLVLQAPGLPALQRQPLVVGSLRGLPRPPPCLRCWPEGSGCTRHICIQAEPGFTSPPRLTVPVLAGSPSSRPGKDR